MAILTLPVEYVKKSLVRLLNNQGCPLDNAEVTASVLLEGELRGYTDHGVHRIFEILEGIDKRTIHLSAETSILREFSAIKVTDGNLSLGHPLAKKCMEEAIIMAKEYGVGVTACIRSSHIGILSYYSEIASSQECIGIVLSTSSPCVVLGKKGKKFLGTNPLSFSIPYKNSPVTGDFSTAIASRGKILSLLKQGKFAPKQWGINKDGEPTNIPQELLEGGIYTLDGGIKGTLISLLISILCGPLIGSEVNPLVTGTRDMSQPPTKGDFFIALDISKFTCLYSFEEKMDLLIHLIETSGSDFRIPGKRALEDKRKNSLNGLALSQEIVDLFNTISPSLKDYD